MSVTVVTQVQRVVVRGSGASYSDARVLAYLRTVLNTNGDLLTVASNTLARIAVGAAPAGSVPIWSGSSWSVGTLTVAVAWDDVTGKPSTFPPSTHSHTPSDVTGFNAAAVDAVEAVGNGVLVTTGGTAAAVAGATTNHALLWNGTTWVAGAVPYSALSGVPSTFAPSSHTHTASEITDFATAWTAQFTAFGSGASVNDVPKWNGSAWVAGAQSGGGMTNPMTTAWDLIRGGASGTPTRLAVGRPHAALKVTAAAGLDYATSTSGFGVSPPRYSYAIANGTGTPIMFGVTTAVTRTFSSQGSGINLARLLGSGMHRVSTSGAANQWTGWSFQLAPGSNQFPPAIATGIFRHEAGGSSATACGLIVGSTINLTSSTGPYFVQTPEPGVQGSYYGLRCRLATQSTWHLVMYDGTTSTEIDTGVAFSANSNTSATDGTNHGLVVGRDAEGVFWEIWDELTAPPTLLGRGRQAANVPTSIGSSGYAQIVALGIGTVAASTATCSVNALGYSSLTAGGY